MKDLSAGTSVRPRAVRDFWPRVLSSPLLGAFVANVSGLIDHSRHSPGALAGSYAWFAFVAFVVWEGNRRLYFRLPRREDWLLTPWRRLGLLLTGIAAYTIPVSALLLWLWREATGDVGTRPMALPAAVAVIVLLAVAIAHVYETVFLLSDWERDRLRSARIEKARHEAELRSLGREVDPHFLFNNLNALAHLVDQRSEAASWFIRTLSASYRYVLDCRGRALVPLADELSALERHKALGDVRYVGSVRLTVRVPPADARRLLLPPVSLSELFQNALKHNLASPERPLHIRVTLEETTLLFENDLRPCPGRSPSTGLGLANLSERFRVAAGTAAEWSAADGRFVVRLPLVRREGGANVPFDHRRDEEEHEMPEA